MIRQKAQGMSFISGTWPLDPKKPTLVFVHGAALSAKLWEGQILGLKDVANAIAPDLPGHGESEGPPKETVSGYTEALLGFLEAIEAPNPIPVGLSMGGAIVLRFLLDHPGRFPAAVLINTGAKLRVASGLLEMIRQNYEAFARSIVETTLTADAPDEIKEKLLACVTPNPNVALKDFLACDAFDLRQELHRIQEPVLVMAASEDLLTPLKYATFLEQNLGSGRLVVIKNAGHLSPIEKPKEVNEAISAFVGSLKF